MTGTSASASASPPPPPYSLCPLVEHAFESPKSIRAASIAPSAGHAYLAASDGSFKVYNVSSASPPVEEVSLDALPSAASSITTTTTTTTKARAVNKISVVAHLARMLVLAESLLSFYHVPSCHPGSAGAAAGLAGGSSIKGVLAFDIDYASATPDSVELVILKKKGAGLFRMTHNSVQVLREVQLPNALVTAIALRDWCLCYADLEAYSIMDLRTAQHMPHFLPISQDVKQEGDQPDPDQRPAIVPVEGEFLLASHSGQSTLGVFVSADSGEPSRGTMQWPSNVRSLALQHNLILALLLDRTIHMHLHRNQSHIHTLHLPDSIPEPRSLIPSPNAPLVVPTPPHILQPLTRVYVELCLSAVHLPDDEPPSTPGQSPTFDSVQPNKLAPHRISASLVSTSVDTLLGSRSGIAAILPLSVVSITQHHLDRGTYAQALAMASASDCPSELKAYIHLRIGLDYLHQTNFDETGPCLVMACAFGVDPRLFIRLFPDLRLSHWSTPSPSPTSAVAPFGAVAALNKYSSVDALILANLMRNYSPHLDPEQGSSHLRTSLQISSRNMIRLVCESVRAQNSWPADEPEVKVAVLTALAKLQAEDGQEEECLARITEGASAADIEEWLEDRHALHLLSKLYLQSRRTVDRLKVLSKMVDEQIEPVPSLENIAELASQQSDEGLRLHYAFWLVERDAADLGLSALWSDKSLSNDEQRLQVYEQLRSKDVDVATRYLDGIALTSQSVEVTRIFIESIFVRLKKDAKVDRTGHEETEDNSSDMSCPERLMAQEDGLRLRLILLLTTRKQLDWADLRARLESMPPLAFERSVVYGQLGLWRQGLSTLAISANDVASAECFCVRQGMPMNPHTLRRIMDHLKLTSTEDMSLNQSSEPLPSTGELLQTLIDILLNSGHPNSSPALTRFINAQSRRLDPASVLDRIPASVSIQDLSPFFSRALRRTAHEKQETMFCKTLAAARAMDVGAELYEVQKRFSPRHIDKDPSDAASAPTKPAAPEPKDTELVDLATKALHLDTEEGEKKEDL